MANSENRKRGLKVTKQLWGEAIPLNLNDPFTQMSVEHLFGEVWARPGLALRDRSLITCATLVALGKEAELKIHLRGLLNQGVSQLEVEEMMVHLAHYAGWPCAVAGLRTAREIFDAA